MKIPKVRYEYRWKIKIEGYKVYKGWGLTFVEASRNILSIFKGFGFSNPVYFKIGKGRHLIKIIRKHKYGQKTIIAYVTRLNIRRIKQLDAIK